MTSEFTIAVHALVFLNHKDATVPSETIAENVCTNPARVRKVLAKLKKSGLVETREGAQGGYRFLRTPDEVSLAEVKAALETDLVDPSWRSGSLDKKCLISSGMGDLMGHLYGHLDRICTDALQEVTIGDIDRRIFQGIEKGAWFL